jgi:hypothetical protein
MRRLRNWEVRCKETKCNDFSNISVLFYKQRCPWRPSLLGTLEMYRQRHKMLDVDFKQECTHVKNGVSNFKSKKAFKFQETRSP